MEKSMLLDRLGAVGEDRLLLAKVLDRAGQARRRNVPSATDFLSPQQRILALDLLRLAMIPETEYLISGGYEGAERALILFLPDWLDAESAELPIRYLRASFRAEDPLTHRDLLGSLMGMGIVREKVGDLLVGPGSADLIVSDTVAEFLLQNWSNAGRTRLRLAEIPQGGLRIPELRRREVRDTVSSLRLDAVAAAGFRLSRSKAADLISSGRVQVNWRTCTKPDQMLLEGDTVSARGFGKFVLAETGGATRKGRTPIVLQQYV